jgi:hypothetical protein
MGNQAQDDAGAVNNNESDATAPTALSTATPPIVSGDEEHQLPPNRDQLHFLGNTDAVHSSDEWGQIDGNTGWMTINYACIQGWTGSRTDRGRQHRDDPLFAEDCRAVGRLTLHRCRRQFGPGMADTDMEGNPRIMFRRRTWVHTSSRNRWSMRQPRPNSLPRNWRRWTCRPGPRAASPPSWRMPSLPWNRPKQCSDQKLEAFIHEVEAQRGKKIVEAEADALIAAAQAIIVLLLSL